MPSIDQWKTTWLGLGVPITTSLLQAFEEITSRYSESHRRYHTLQHLDECFAKLAELRSFTEHGAEIEVALWFHDAIYDTRSKENEARSAELAASTVLTAGGLPESAARISELILDTRHATVPNGNDAQILVDVDLSILGAKSDRFDEYERQVREEYSWVPDLLFRPERKKILTEFLSRPSIFNTQLFMDRYEQQARANIERSISHLRE